MDFFETQERYRRREMRGWFALLSRVAIVGGACGGVCGNG